MLVVVKNRNFHPRPQGLFDFEAFRRLDVFKVDAAESRLQAGDDFDEFIRVLLVHLDVETIDTGEFFEQYRLALHHRLAGQRADIAEAQAPPCRW